jgi:hypothetical protein
MRKPYLSIDNRHESVRDSEYFYLVPKAPKNADAAGAV